MSENQIAEANVPGVIADGTKVLLMVVYHIIRTEFIEENDTISRFAMIPIWPLGFHWNLAKQVTVTTTRVSRSKSVFLLQTLQAGSFSDVADVLQRQSELHGKNLC